MMIFRRSLIGGGLLAMGGGGHALAMGAFADPVIRRHALALPGWPAGLSLRLAVLADLHAGAPVMTLARVERIVAATNALRPDMTVLLGDYGPVSRLVRRPYAPDEVAVILGRLHAPLGVFAIAGNHDWWEDPAAMAGRSSRPEWLAALERHGVTPLQNTARRLPQGFWLAGLDSQAAFGRRGGADDLPATLAQVTDDAPLILLAHEPDIFAQLPGRVALTLSGHTHGGQVRLFGYSPVVPSRFGNRYAYGRVREAGRELIVSGGLGTSILPLRLGVPPEIVEVTLGG